MLQKTVYTHTQNQIRCEALLRIRKAYQLSSLLNITEAALNYHINKPLYRLFQIPKKSGTFRMIEAPNDDLKNIQQHLNLYLQALYESVRPHTVHGFVKHVYGTSPCGIISNAKVHCGKKHVLNIDLKDFFPSLSAKRIKEVLSEEPFALGDEAALLITLLCTYHKHLPTGAPTSPVLANMACYQMDKALEEFCKNQQLIYTRYADDLTFSSSEKITVDTMDQLKQIITTEGFTVHPKKQRLVSNKGQQKVTGLVVNEKVNVDRSYIRKIRAMIYSLETMGAELAAAKHFRLTKMDAAYTFKFLHKLKGQLEFVGQVRGKEDKLYLHYTERWLKALKEEK